MAKIKRLKKSKFRSAKSSNHDSALEALARPFLQPLVAIPFHISCFEESQVLLAPSFTGQPKRLGSAEEALEAIESMHLYVMPRDSAKGISHSHDFRVLMESFKLLRTDWDSILSTQSSLPSLHLRRGERKRRGGERNWRGVERRKEERGEKIEKKKEERKNYLIQVCHMSFSSLIKKTIFVW